MSTKPRKRSALAAIFAAAIALVLALPGVASAAEPAGTFTKYSPLNVSSVDFGIASGPDGNVWFTTPSPNNPFINNITPSEGEITHFTEGLNPKSTPGGIASGSDGNLWFTDKGGTFAGGVFAIGRITPSGTITEFSSGLYGGFVATKADIAAGPDGNLWFSAEPSNEIQAVKFSGFSPGDTFTLTFNGETTAAITYSATVATLRSNIKAALEAKFGANFANQGAAAANSPTTGIGVVFTGKYQLVDQSLMTCATVSGSGTCTVAQSANGGPGSIGRITPSGTITQFSAGLNEGAKPISITAGPDGNLWFADDGTTKAIGRITPSGTITEFSAGLNEGAKSASITAGPDGNLWFTDDGTTKAIGRITPSGTITEFSLSAGSAPRGIAAGPDGNVWFTNARSGSPAVGRITPSGGITEFSAGFSTSAGPTGIALGPEGNMWVTDGSELAIWKVGTEPSPELTVAKEGTGAGTVVSSPAGIECGATCSAEYATNTKVTLTASPSAGSLFVSWKGCEKGGVNGRQCTVTMDKAKTVNAKFITAYDVTVNRVGSGLGKVSSSPGGVLCLSNCSSTSAAFKEGTSVTLSAAPTKNYVFTEWTGDCSGSGPCSLGSLGADKTVGAKFTAVAQHNLTVTKSGGGQGTAKSNLAGINCGATCSSMAAAYFQGAVVELTATPGKGSAFGGWSGGGCSGTGTCTVTMSEAKSVTAEFK